MSDKKPRDEGMRTRQQNIEYLNNTTYVFYSRAEHTAYMAIDLNNDFICSTFVVAAAIFEFIAVDRMATSSVHQSESATAAKYALSCPDFDIIIDMRKLNARSKGDTFNMFCAKMAELVDGRMDDHRHGEALFMPVATSIPNIIKITVDTLELQHVPKTFEESGIQVPSLVWVTLQFCAKNP